MGGSYRQCDDCGKRALSIATRCPGCGREFTAPEVPRPGPAEELGRYVSPGMVMGALLAAAVIASATMDSDARPRDARASVAAPDPVMDSVEVGYTAAAPRLETESVAGVAPSSAGEVLVARDWTNVRKSRSRRAPLEAILTPGDTVVADSLDRDWYRVALEGEVLGYAHRTTLRAPR